MRLQLDMGVRGGGGRGKVTPAKRSNSISAYQGHRLRRVAWSKVSAVKIG